MKKCPSRSITPYLDGELAPDARTQVEEHLQTCASCGALLDEVTSARERVRSMGRAIIPDTVLMPAVEIFREKGGIGPQGRQLDFSRVPSPASAEAVAVMDEDAATDTPETEVDEDERYHAVLNTPPAVAAVLLEAPAMDVPSTRTWVNVAPPEAAVDPETVLESEAVLEPEAVTEPAPAVASESVQGRGTAAPSGPADLAEEEPSAAARWLGSDFDEAISPEAMYALEAGAALDARPEPPAPQQVPPWLDAEEADTEDIEAHGRRVIEERLEAERLQAERLGAPGGPRDVPEVFAAVEAVEATPEPVVEPVAEAAKPEPVAQTEVEPSWPHPPERPKTVAAGTSGPSAESWVDDYRDSLRTRTEPRRGAAGLDSLDTQVKIGLGIAATIVLLLAAIFGLPRLFTHSPRSVATTATSRPSASTASPSNQATLVPSPQVSAPMLVPALTGVLPAGKGGTGYKVYRIRALNPKAGLYLIAFDLQGSGPLPDVQLGEAADHSLYLQSAGTTIDPALTSAFPGAGPVTAMSPTGAAATSLKLTTSAAPHFFMYYLTGPSRLVIQLS